MISFAAGFLPPSGGQEGGSFLPPSGGQEGGSFLPPSGGQEGGLPPPFGGIRGGLFASGEILALLVAQHGFAADNLLSQVGESQDALGGELGLTNLAGGLAEQAHILDVLTNLEVSSVGAGAAGHLSGEDAEVAQLHGLTEQDQFLDASHHVGEDALDDALRIGGVVVAHVLSQLGDSDGVSVLHAAVDTPELLGILVLVLVKVNVQHNNSVYGLITKVNFSLVFFIRLSGISP